MLKFYLDRYKTQEMRDEAVDACLPALKFVSDWSVTNKMIEKHDNVVFSNGDIIFLDTDSDNATFFSDDIILNTIDLNEINHHGVNFDPETIIHVRLTA